MTAEERAIPIAKELTQKDIGKVVIRNLGEYGHALDLITAAIRKAVEEAEEACAVIAEACEAAAPTREWEAAQRAIAKEIRARRSEGEREPAASRAARPTGPTHGHLSAALKRSAELADHLRAIKAFSEAHHEQQPARVLLHALLVDIPAMCEKAMGPDVTLRVPLEETTRFTALREWAERARLVIYDYRRCYGTDHRNQELADSLDLRAKHVMQDWQDW